MTTTCQISDNPGPLRNSSAWDGRLSSCPLLSLLLEYKEKYLKMEYQDLFESLKYEENRGYKYKHAHPDPTRGTNIGYGHQMTGKPDDRDTFERLFKGSVDYDLLRSGQAHLPERMASTLLWDDILKRERKIQRYLPNWNQMPHPARSAALHMYYRGAIPKEYPKTLQLIKEGKYSDAAKEYLNSKEYTSNVGPEAKHPGIAKRMEKTSRLLASAEKTMTTPETRVAKLVRSFPTTTVASPILMINRMLDALALPGRLPKGKPDA